MRTNTAGRTPPDLSDSLFPHPLTPGRVDGLGERFSTTDADGSPLELLRFRADLAATTGFEEALRARMLLLAGLDHPAFPKVRHLVQHDGRLTLVSAAAPGRRLPEITAGALSARLRPAFVVRLLRDASRALAALEATGAGVTHAALTADRIAIAADGQVILSEYGLAPVFEQMALWPEELWLQFGLLAPADDDGRALFDARTSLMQLAATALSVLLKRPISLHDFEHRLPALLDEAAGLSAATPSALLPVLTTWLTRALLDDPQAYHSSADAAADLDRLLTAGGPDIVAELTQPFPPASARERVTQRRPTREPDVEDVAAAAPVGEPEVASPVAAVPASFKWIAAVLAVLVVGEAAVIARLLLRTPAAVPVEAAVLIESPASGDSVIVDGRTVGATPLRLRITPQMQAIRVMPAPAAPVDATVPPASTADEAAALIEQAAARQRSGGVRFSSPIELKVLQGDRVLGSTADGPIVTTAGTHQLEFVNTALGYRARQSVTVRAGVITAVTITPPMGRISINAQPWAQVLIDNTSVGETPLANVPASLGEHEIVFRHPQLGERREKVTVRADEPARVSTTFLRQ